MIARLTIIGAALGVLTACAGDTARSSSGSDEPAMVQKGTYVYNPNKRHAPVSLSGADLAGIAIR